MTTEPTAQVETTFTCVVIAGKKVVDDMMHAADMFEPFKALGTPHKVTVTLKPGGSTERAMDTVKQGFEHEGFRVSAIFLPGSLTGFWRDPTVKTISDGKKWAVLDTVLAAYGYESVAVPPGS